MLINSTKLTLANTMMIGVIMTICSNNWISMWMGLEISMLSFLPFMVNKNKLSSESMVKYFIIQSVASTIFLLSVICMLIGVNMLNEMTLTISMLIKLGSAPFHMWVLMIIEMINYLPLFFLLTVLKIPPLSILYQINTKMLTIPIILSMFVSSISCLNQSSMRKTLGFSSIYNISLMMISINKFNVMMIYLMIYSTMMILLTNICMKMKINFINQMIFNEFSIWMKINMWINMLSMSGFPPLMGFSAKLMIIQTLINSNEFIMVIFLVVTSFLVMMFYMRLTFSSLMNLYSFKKWTLNKITPVFYLFSLNLMLNVFYICSVSTM
uniref:NADH dehydrogenase subunit 2 n=1 Tax=Abrus daozhenensis TaxID=2959344 RepID=UPI0021146A15|nr:NADH dehydrogenase subunit 2 [Abrus daozhenensis]USS62512.1 NADH dehydrogenase subunit 2 [Abrus daozhenensis]